MADTVKIQLQGSILNSLAQKTTSTQISAPANNMPNSVLSQNINSGNNNTSNSFDGSKVTSALATISNKIEKGFMQTVSVLTNMQVALTSRLETINRQLQKLNELMSLLHETQIKLTKQRTTTSSLRLAEILEPAWFKTMVRFREQLIEPLSKEAINVAISRLVMNNSQLKKAFGYQTQEHQRRQRSANFTYELYQTLMNIPTFLNKVGSEVINSFSQYIINTGKCISDNIINYFKIQHGIETDRFNSEMDHWKNVEKTLGNLLLCCLKKLSPQEKREFRTSAISQNKIITKKYRNMKEKYETTQQKLKTFKTSIQNRKEYEIKSINIFEKLLENTITINNSIGLIAFKVAISLKGVLIQVLKTYLGVKFFSTIVRSVLKILPDSVLNKSAEVGGIVESFLKTHLTTVFNKILPESIRGGFLSASKSIWDGMKNFATMLFSTDDKKREQARGVFIAQLQTTLTKIFSKFVAPITRILLAWKAAQTIGRRYGDYLTRAKNSALTLDSNTGKMVLASNRGIGARFRGMAGGQPLITAGEALNTGYIIRRTPGAVWGGIRRTSSAVLGGLTRPMTNPYINPSLRGVGGGISGLVHGVMRSPLIIKSIISTISSLFLGIGKILLGGVGLFSLGTILYKVFKMLSSQAKENNTTVRGFIVNVFKDLAAQFRTGLSWMAKNGWSMLKEVTFAIFEGVAIILEQTFTDMMRQLQLAFYKAMSWLDYYTLGMMPGSGWDVKIAILEKIIQQAEQSALDTIEKNKKLQEDIDKRKEAEEARKQKEQEIQQNIYDLVDKIKSYFVEGEFTKTLVKTATLIGEGIAKIVGVISDTVKNISNNSAGIFGNFAQVAGGFLKGMVGESGATKVIDSAIAYANARGYTGVVSMLGSARKSVTEKMADSADTQTKAATAQDIAARGQAAAAIEQAKAAEEQKIAAEQQRINLEKLAEQQRKDIERRAEQHTKFLEDLQKAFVDPYKDPLDPNQVMAGPGDLADARTLLYGRNSSSWGNWGPGQFYKKMPGEPTPRYDRTGSYWGVGPYGVPGLASNMMSKDPMLASSLNIRNAIMGHTAQQYGQGSFYNDPYINYAPRTSAEKNAMHSFFGLPEGSTISSKYGPRSSGNHYGIDFATGGQRKPVYAPFAGTVVASKRDTGSGYGNTMAIFYPEISTVFKYAHLHKAPLAAHTSVKAGDKIGIIGNTGTSRGATGIHLHLETIPITDKSQLTEGFLYNRNIYHKITTNPIGIFKQYEGKQSARAAFGSPTNTPVAPEPKPTQVEARVTGAGASGDLRNASAQGGAGNVAFTQYNFNNNTTSTTASNNVPDDFNLLQLMMIGLGGY